MHKHYNIHEVVKDMSPEHLNSLLSFRIDFLDEELGETVRAFNECDPEEIVDGLIDLIVIAAGTLDLFEVDTKKAWQAVLEANMAKEAGINPSRPNELGLPDLVKGPDWIPPSHEGNHGLLTKAFRPYPVTEDDLNKTQD